MTAARRWMLGFFLLSGFTSLLYQTVWMRLALARFGITAAIVAAVLSIFMAGLAAGSTFGAGLIALAGRRLGWGPLRLYGAAELLVAVGGCTVPWLFGVARHLLLAMGAAGSGAYTLASAALIAAVLLPFCCAMGFTVPAAVAFLAASDSADPTRAPFGALYAANVAGAVVGALLTPLVFVELFGFVATSLGAAAVNVAIGTLALTLFRRDAAAAPEAEARAPAAGPGPDAAQLRLALFVTGLSTMGMEVVWTRIYPTVIGTFVYSFAAILAIYLVATTLGATAHRRAARRGGGAARIGIWWPWLGATSLLPLLSASVQVPLAIGPYTRVVCGLAPFCAILGLVTPALVDRLAGDDPERVGRAYAINLLGCLIGPVAAGFVLLPTLGTRWTALALALPLFLVSLLGFLRREAGWVWRLTAAAAAVGVWQGTTLFEEQFPRSDVRVDRVATVVAAGSDLKKHLFVNGVGMTQLTTITKIMAHFPAAHLPRERTRPLQTLVICFGMGTSFRSLASWGASVTAVELVPSVTDFFGFYFPDAEKLLAERKGQLRIVHDDGRRYLDRTLDTYDLITIDPPPPVEAAGSSMLYSKDFYASVAKRLKPGGIFQIWIPGGDRATIAGVTLSAIQSFPHVRMFPSIYGYGLHILASNAPIPKIGAEDLVASMPEPAKADLVEWVDLPPEKLFRIMLGHEYRPEALLFGRDAAATIPISDDRPVNEFYFLRRTLGSDAPVAEMPTGSEGAP